MAEQQDNKQPEQQQEGGTGQEPIQADYAEGRELRGEGDLTRAAACFHNALLDFEQKNDDKGVANAAAQLGDICAETGEPEKALDHYQRAYDICKKAKDMFSLVALLKKMVDSKKALKQYDEAVKLYLNVIDIYAGYNNPAGTVAAMEDLAGLYLEMGRRRKAAETYRTIASIHKNFRHTKHASEFMEKAEKVEQAGSPD